MRIPKAVAEDAQVQAGQAVTVTVPREGSLVIKSARRKYRLSQLVSGITAKNRQQETDWGEPRSKEVW